MTQTATSQMIANFPELNTTWTPTVGDIVENFGEVGRVISIDEERGLMLRKVGGRMRWLADPEKCRPVR